MTGENDFLILIKSFSHLFFLPCLCIFLQESCIEFERLVTTQCEALIQAIHDRREYLLEAIRMDKDTKIRILKVGGFGG